MPGYLCVHQVPPKVSCISRMTKLVPGILFRRCQALPMPEIPAPTISTSKCSVACDADAKVLRAVSTFIWLFLGVDRSDLNCPLRSSSGWRGTENQTAFDPNQSA